MSLDTLLEAAEFIEWSAHTKPRDDYSPEGKIITYIKSEMLVDGDDYEDNSSIDDSIESQRGEDRSEKRRAGGAGTRETHNKLEKNRRAHLKECFDILKVQVPFMEDKKTSNLSILRGALKFIQALKRKEKELEKDLYKLAMEKSSLREKIAKLKVDLAKLKMDVDLTKWMPINEQESNSISTASGAGSPILSDTEDYYSKRTQKRKKKKRSIKEKNKPVIKNIPVKIIQPNRVLTPATTTTYTTAVGIATMTPTMPTHIRAPVTQLLHQTLSKRQALQRQREQLAVCQANPVTSSQPAVPAIMNQLLRQQLSFPVGTSMPIGTTLPVANLLSSTMTMPSSTKGFQSNILLTTTTTTAKSAISSNMGTYTTTASATTPRIMPASTVHGLNHMSTSSDFSHLTAVAGQPSTVPCSDLTPYTSFNTTSKATQMITTIVTPSVTSLASMSAIKPILAPQTPTQYLHGHLLNPILAQFPNRSPLLTSMPSHQAAMTTGPQPQIVSLSHMGTMMPMTSLAVLPQGYQMTGLSAAQFSSIMSPQLLKQIPLLQQPMLQQMPQGQTMGQPLVKPVVVVSLPNTATSGTSALSMNITTS